MFHRFALNLDALTALILSQSGFARHKRFDDKPPWVSTDRLRCSILSMNRCKHVLILVSYWTITSEVCRVLRMTCVVMELLAPLGSGTRTSKKLKLRIDSEFFKDASDVIQIALSLSLSMPLINSNLWTYSTIWSCSWVWPNSLCCYIFCASIECQRIWYRKSDRALYIFLESNDRALEAGMNGRAIS